MNAPQLVTKSTKLMVALAVVSSFDTGSATAQNYLTVLKGISEIAPAIAEPVSTDEVSNSSQRGSTEVFRERYPNGEVRVEREVTLDSDGNYVNHGTWKMWDPTGLLIADGQFNMGKRVGSWTRILGRKDADIIQKAPFNRFKAPFTSNVNFTNDKMDGDWLIVDMEQKKCCQIGLENGVRNGLTIFWMPNGEVMRQEQFDHGVPVGDVLQTNSSTGKLDRAATYLNGRRVTSNVDYYSRAKRQKKTEELFLAPKTVQNSPDEFWACKFATYEQQGEPLRHGTAKSWYSNGQLQSEGQYEHHKRVGHFRFWHPNGQISSEGNFADDNYTGLWVWWHENGQKAIVGRYEHGKNIGEWRWWDELGKLANRQVYDATADATPADDSRTSQADLPELLLTK